MITKTKLALAALLTLGIASAAQAGSRDDADSSGGYRTGPLGQTFNSGVNPVDHPSMARDAFASGARNARPAPATRRPAAVEAGRKAYGYTLTLPAREPAYMAIQDRYNSD